MRYALVGAPAALVALLLTVPAVAAQGNPSGAASAATTVDTERYYVVGPAVRGQPEYLYAIAAATLHDGNRYLEIFALNRDRLQPDGRRMTDPAVVEPGWILALPRDARGPRVRVGRLPQPPPTAPVPSLVPAANAAAAATPAVDRQPLLDYPVLGGLVLLTAATLVVVRRRSAPVAPARPPRPPWPAPAPPVQPAPPSGPAGPSRPLRPSGPAGDSPAKPPVTTRRLPVPVRPDEAAPSHLQAELVCGGDHGTLRLIGTGSGPPGPATCWLAPGGSPPAGRLGLVLGRGTGGRLWLDLALAPDVLTVTGDPAAGLRFARSVIDQLWAAGTAVTVLGDRLRDDLPAGCRHVPTLAELPVSLSAGARVLLAAGLPVRTLRELRPLVDGPATAAIVVGDVPAARWSLHFAEARGRAGSP